MPFKNPHPLYSVWASMHDRCRNPNARQWNDYGGRGISVCDRWKDFSLFAADMGERPDGFSLDRIDNDKGYSPDNCRWASRRDQMRNQRRTRVVEIDGVSHKAIDLADQTGLKVGTIVDRAARGLTLAEVLDPTRRIVADWRCAVAGKKAKAKARTHCRNGHEFTEPNTRIDKTGRKHCRTCHNAKMRRLNANKRSPT